MANNELPSIPGYLVEKKLGQGGMAAVYLATHESTGQPVAIKIMSNALGEDETWVRRFINEAKTVAQLSHPNIIPVYDVGTFDGHFYISMDTMNGGDLEERMAKGMSIPEVLKVVVGVAAGLDFAGEKGFVHRDIKPDNVMFRDDGTPVILDFGIVKQKGVHDSKMTQTGMVIGTTSYMSPEQAQGRDLDERSDIYSLGCMMFELLTGRTPYSGNSAMEVLRMHIEEFPPELPFALKVFQPVIEMAMAKDVRDRYSRGQEMIDHLESLTPKINTLLAQLEAQKNMPDDATAVRDAVDETEVTQTRGTADQETADVEVAIVTAETEIADVLKDARQTIHNYSAATVNKKVKRTKGIIATASIVAVFAVGYVSYQQFYVVPMEMIRAKQAEAEKSQNKISSLLAGAELVKKGLSLSDVDKVDKLMVVYREVLKIEPDNSEAQLALSQFGENYIKLSREALASGSLELAVIYRNYAEKLSPNNTDLLALQDSIISVRTENTQKEMQAKFQQQQIDGLMTDVKKELLSDKVFSELSYGKLQQVLQIDNENIEAENLLAQMLLGLYEAARSDIIKERISIAQKKVNSLERYNYETEKLTVLNRELQAVRQKVSLRQQGKKMERRKADLLTKADRLVREKRSISINEDLRDLYKAVLKIDTSNPKAIAGMEDTSDYDAEIARIAITERNYNRAQQQLSLVQNYTPNYSGLSVLRRELTLAKQSSEKADKVLFEAQRLLASDGAGEARRRELKTINSKLEDVKRVDPNNPKYTKVLSALESEYVSTIQMLMTDNKQNLVAEYFKDIAGKDWPTNRLFQLQLTNQAANITPEIEPEKKKRKRVFTGGF